MKKILAVMLSAAMITGLSLPAMAETVTGGLETDTEYATQVESSDVVDSGICGDKTNASNNGFTLADICEDEGHSFTNYVSNNDATCVADGTKTATCDNGCGATDTIADEGSILPYGFNTEDGKLIYYVNGVRQTTTDVIKIDDTWYNLVDGVVTPNTVAKNSSGWWYINSSSKVDFSFTGFASNANGTWYIRSGKVNFSANGVLKGTYNGASKWGNVKGGKLQKAVTVAKNSNGWWYIGSDGFVNFNFTGLAKNASGWWYCKGGKVNFSFTGLAKNSSGWWYCKNGKVDFSYTGLAKNSSGWWYCSGGKVNFNYTGIASNASGSWYCKGGKVQFGYSGTFNGSKMKYVIKNGKVTHTSTVYLGIVRSKHDAGIPNFTSVTCSGNKLYISGYYYQSPDGTYSTDNIYRTAVLTLTSNTKYWDPSYDYCDSDEVYYTSKENFFAYAKKFYASGYGPGLAITVKDGVVVEMQFFS